MLGWDNSAGCWFVMSIYSPPIAPSSTSPASGLRSGGVFETRSNHFSVKGSVFRLDAVEEQEGINEHRKIIDKRNVKRAISSHHPAAYTKKIREINGDLSHSLGGEVADRTTKHLSPQKPLYLQVPHHYRSARCPVPQVRVRSLDANLGSTILRSAMSGRSVLSRSERAGAFDIFSSQTPGAHHHRLSILQM